MFDPCLFEYWWVVLTSTCPLVQLCFDSLVIHFVVQCWVMCRALLMLFGFGICNEPVMSVQFSSSLHWYRSVEQVFAGRITNITSSFCITVMFMTKWSFKSWYKLFTECFYTNQMADSHCQVTFSQLTVFSVSVFVSTSSQLVISHVFRKAQNKEDDNTIPQNSF